MSGKTRKKVRTASQVAWHQWVLIGLVLCGASFVRLRLLDIPLERDEGEYAYTGQLMLQGIPPYQLAYGMKLPGTYAAYALIMALFGENIRGIHIGLILVNCVTVVLLYFLGRRLFGRICGITAAASFAALSLSDSVLGLAAHATHFVALFAVAGTLLLLRAVESDRLTYWFFAGLAFGLAFLMKQQAIFFAFFAGLFLISRGLRRPGTGTALVQGIGLFCLGALLPFFLTCVALTEAGVFHQFWFWTFSYARQYVFNNDPIWVGWRAFQAAFSRIFSRAPGLWLLALAGIPIAFSSKQRRESALFASGFLVASFATTVPGFYFRAHYFISVLPAVALLIGAGLEITCQKIVVAWNASRLWSAVPISAFLVALTQGILSHRTLFFQVSPREACRAIYGLNPFPESIEVARYIRDHTAPGHRIAVIGSEPQIYFYSRRHSATGYIYTYGLMELQPYALTMQQEMIREIEQTKPEFVVSIDIPWSWLPKQNSEQLIFHWFDNYVETSFDRVGLIELKPNQPATYYWDAEATVANPRSPYCVWVFKRRDSF